jgi:hypothetical protein
MVPEPKDNGIELECYEISFSEAANAMVRVLVMTITKEQAAAQERFNDALETMDPSQLVCLGYCQDLAHAETVLQRARAIWAQNWVQKCFSDSWLRSALLREIESYEPDGFVRGEGNFARPLEGDWDIFAVWRRLTLHRGRIPRHWAVTNVL